MKSREDSFDSYSFKVHTPDGIMYVFIVEDKEGFPFNIQVSAGKTGNSLAAWVDGLCGLINELLAIRVNGRRAYTIDKIAYLLSNFTTGTYIATKNGNRVYAGPDGIKSAIMDYLQVKYVDDRGRT